jgi:hypothetical protein
VGFGVGLGVGAVVVCKLISTIQHTKREKDAKGKKIKREKKNCGILWA